MSKAQWMSKTYLAIEYIRPEKSPPQKNQANQQKPWTKPWFLLLKLMTAVPNIDK